MKKSFSKKLVSNVVAFAVVICSVLSCVSLVKAANTNTTTWNVRLSIGQQGYACTGRKKDNASPIKFIYEGGNDNISVAVYGSDAYATGYTNQTYPNRELSWTNISSPNASKVYYISSYVYETYGSLAYARPYITAGGTGGTYNGRWAPDSTS